MPKKIKVKKIRDFTKSGALSRKHLKDLTNVMSKEWGMKLTYKEFIKAWDNKKTLKSVRYAAIMQHFLKDKSFLDRKFRNTWMKNVGITPVFKNNQLSYLELSRDKGKGLLFNARARVKLDREKRWDILAHHLPQTEKVAVNAILQDPKLSEGISNVVYSSLACRRHLTNLIWLLTTTIKLFDKRCIIVYPNDAALDDLYSSETTKINLHGFPADLNHYLIQDKTFLPLYTFLDLLTQDITLQNALTETYQKSVEIDGIEVDSEAEAEDLIDNVIIEIAFSTEAADNMLKAILFKMRYLKSRLNKADITYFKENKPITEIRHKVQNEKGSKQEYTDYDESLLDKILQGLNRFKNTGGEY